MLKSFVCSLKRHQPIRMFNRLLFTGSFMPKCRSRGPVTVSKGASKPLSKCHEELSNTTCCLGKHKGKRQHWHPPPTPYYTAMKI